MIYPTDPSWITAKLKTCRSALKLRVALTFIALLLRRSPRSMSVARSVDVRAFWMAWQSDWRLCDNTITFIFRYKTLIWLNSSPGDMNLSKHFCMWNQLVDQLCRTSVQKVFIYNTLWFISVLDLPKHKKKYEMIKLKSKLL